MTVDATPTASRSFHAISSCSGSAMSDIEQTGGEVRQDHLLVRRGQDVRALGHEVHAAEDDELGVLMVADALRRLPRVAGVVGELDHLVALVVVAEDDEALAERRPRRRDPAVHLLDGQAEVALRERLPLADVLVLELRQDVDGAHGSIVQPGNDSGVVLARLAGDQVVEGVALVGSRPAREIRRRIAAVVMISGVSDPAMW